MRRTPRSVLVLRSPVYNLSDAGRVGIAKAGCVQVIHGLFFGRCSVKRQSNPRPANIQMQSQRNRKFVIDSLVAAVAGARAMHSF